MQILQPRKIGLCLFLAQEEMYQTWGTCKSLIKILAVIPFLREEVKLSLASHGTVLKRGPRVPSCGPSPAGLLPLTPG